MHHYLYLFIDLLSLSVPLLFSFHPKAKFILKWKYLAPAILLPAFLFIAWDAWFVRMGVWGFNPRYLIGIYFFDLPLEEIIFFLCIPYACLFTYEALNHYTRNRPHPNNGQRITWVLIVGLIVTGILNYDRWYPSVTALVLSLLLLFLVGIVRPSYLGRFYFAYLFILLPFFIINGALTGTGMTEPIVWYNPAETLGFRMGTIPIEDPFYGMVLILMNVSIFEYLQKRSRKAL